MELGFETAGNATLICHDRVPVLATDPWLSGSAYFGSWDLSHEIAAEQLEAIRRCPLLWISHGHPDHLSAQSLDGLRGKTILLPDAVGGRIRGDLERAGFTVRVLADRTWTPLSERIRVLCIADSNQDGILLVDIGGRLVVNLNDASEPEWFRFVKQVISHYPISFLLRLTGYGDADMINLFHEDGTALRPWRPKRVPVGAGIAELTRRFGTRYFIPFSSMHRYQRSDSIWASQYTTRLSDYPVGFDSPTSELLPAFVRYDCTRDHAAPIAPPERPAKVFEPSEFGDDWSEPLDSDEQALATRYFQSIEHLADTLDFVNLRVGGRDHHIALSRRRLGSGLTFEAPRHSLMTSIREQIFDDLLIGNFMKTTLHGKAVRTGLFPDFTPYVAKYADNGRARTRDELAAYFAQYRRRAPFDFVRARLEKRSRNAFRALFQEGSAVYRLARSGYRLWKAAA
jgi:hypothetical protein